MTPCSKTELLARISANARQFELAPLLRVLRKQFPEYALHYRGRSSLACEPSLIDRVELEGRRIVIHLNLGLMSSTSPLASYFLRLRHDTRAGPGLEQLLNLCDDALLRARAEASQPLATSQRSAEGHPAIHALRETLWQLHQPRSVATLHWLFKRVFPELEVSVRRVPREHKTPAGAARNGWATLGGTALEAEVSVTVPGYEVTLAADDTDSPCGNPWHQEIAIRLGALSPACVSFDSIALRVILIDRASTQRLILQGTELGFSSLVDACPPRLSWL
ncbi:MAG: hypothetical protein ACM3ZE_24965 [Myxococcales bacterium]